MNKLTFPVAQIDGRSISFAETGGWELAKKCGAFHLSQPEDMNFDAGIRFAKSYYLPESKADGGYTGFQTAELSRSKLGYSNPIQDQVEFFQLESFLWESYLPSMVAKLLWRLNDLAKAVLMDVMARCDVPLQEISKITGGLEADQALQYCIFNHYRSSKSAELGFTAHKDSGFITLLYTTESGLETKYGGDWIDLPSKKNCLTVVLGHSLEVLTAKLPNAAVEASYHRVRPSESERNEDRFTFGVYLGPRMDQDLYQLQADRSVEVFQSFLEFQKAKAAEMKYEFHPRITDKN